MIPCFFGCFTRDKVTTRTACVQSPEKVVFDQPEYLKTGMPRRRKPHPRQGMRPPQMAPSPYSHSIVAGGLEEMS